MLHVSPTIALIIHKYRSLKKVSILTETSEREHCIPLNSLENCCLLKNFCRNSTRTSFRDSFGSSSGVPLKMFSRISSEILQNSKFFKFQFCNFLKITDFSENSIAFFFRKSSMNSFRVKSK